MHILLTCISPLHFSPLLAPSLSPSRPFVAVIVMNWVILSVSSLGASREDFNPSLFSLVPVPTPPTHRHPPVPASSHIPTRTSPLCTPLPTLHLIAAVSSIFPHPTFMPVFFPSVDLCLRFFPLVWSALLKSKACSQLRRHLQPAVNR